MYHYILMFLQAVSRSLQFYISAKRLLSNGTCCYVHSKPSEIIYSLFHYVFHFVFGWFWCCHVYSSALLPNCCLKYQRSSMFSQIMWVSFTFFIFKFYLFLNYHFCDISLHGFIYWAPSRNF